MLEMVLHIIHTVSVSMSKKGVQPCRAKTRPARSQCKASYLYYNSIRVPGSKFLAQFSSILSANEISEGQLCKHQSSCMAVTTAADDDAENEIEVLI